MEDKGTIVGEETIGMWGEEVRREGIRDEVRSIGLVQDSELGKDSGWVELGDWDTEGREEEESWEGNWWEKLEVKGIWGLVYEEEWAKGKRVSLKTAYQAM